MSYLVLARKYRPQTFDGLVGQGSIARTLTNAIAEGRLAHAFLFTGSRGVGKTSTARILAKGLNCERGPTADPCGVCESCKEIAQGTSVNVFEIDGASNTSVDDVRALRETLQYLPPRGKYKVYVIDEV
ncbi:MAG: AAA family ATPase, partial [Myxococcales bacterium]|nr:AAA family ATPase [Myxococcales bacterium]